MRKIPILYQKSFCRRQKTKRDYIFLSVLVVINRGRPFLTERLILLAKGLSVFQFILSFYRWTKKTKQKQKYEKEVLDNSLALLINMFIKVLFFIVVLPPWPIIQKVKTLSITE